MPFSYVFDSGARKGESMVKSHPFEGIIPNITRRWRETESSVVRDDLARLRSRSEEHTSELQSQSNLVCRLLLEKKNNAEHADGQAEQPPASQQRQRPRSPDEH